ncbi:MAG: hypothetical protein PHO75_00095 [Candidatus Shapirobacteria bacterium]|nr:hypothetical protein [Candidatus Shapirobacteria bacterium]
MNDVQEKIILPIKEGFNKSIGDDLIPVRNNPKKLNRNFISDVNEILDLNKRSILIFPQVVGDIDYNPELPFQSGIFHIYKTRLKQELSSVPLIPVYVHGCDS